jgi:predicted dehydrogenase
MPVEDAAQMLARFRSGTTAELTFAFANQPRPLVCDLELIGTAGQLIVHTWRGYELDNRDGHIEKTFYTGEPHWQKVLIGLTGEIEEFCAAIREDRPPRPPAEDSVRSLEVVEAFYRAVKSGQMERV